MEWPREDAARAEGPGRVATIAPSGSGDFAPALAEAARLNLFARVTDDRIVVSDEPRVEAARGSLLAHTIRNEREDLDAFIEAMAERGVATHAMDGGYPSEGPALGNNANMRFITPRVALLRGGGVSSLSFGHTWHMLDVRWPAPHTVLEATELRRVDWDDYNVLVLPSARSLSSTFDGGALDALKEWVRGGGTVVAIGGSAAWASTELLGMERDENVGGDDGDDEGDDDDGEADEDDEEEAFRMTYAERRDRRVENRVPGALLAAEIDTTHPLAAGMDGRVGFHVFSGRPLPVEDDGYVVARFMETSDGGSPRIGGSISEENLSKLAGTPAVTQHRMGGGAVVCFASDPTNRGMNRAGMRLLMNAILLSPSNAGALQPLGEDAHEHEH